LHVVLEINPQDLSTNVDEVVSFRPPLEVTRSQTASTVLHEEVDALPLNGRSFLDIALVAPGVSPTNVGGGTQLFPETSAVPGVGLSVSSQRNFSNSFVVDGVSANDDAAGLSGIPVGVDAVEELQVVTSGGQAELGRALGGYVNLVTRSGTNTWKGSSYGYFRDDALNGTNALSGTRLPMHQNQYGLTIGGPLESNRTFVFGNLERRDLDQTGFVTISDENAATINARLIAVGYGGQPVATGLYRDPIQTWLGLAKVDEQVTDADRLGVYKEFRAKYDSRQYAAAKPLAEKLVQLTEEQYGAEELQVSTPLTNLATVNYKLGDFPTAIQNYQRSLRILQSKSTMADKQQIRPLHGLGVSFMGANDPESAVVALKRAADLSRNTEGLFNISQIEFIDPLIDAYAATGRYAEAEKEALYAMRVEEAAYGRNSSSGAGAW
jgi:hypothetical protein